ncbi:glycosyltransferase [Cellulomonas sp. JZ18]|uniref:glycosyltransferase n=1 Tax=Cellulomonas sp. JZ18 TaxID=2654191 RepID=UPI0012D4A344|nr:glycosyltransferase [Cellulomonas sp. JZ18]QGQ18898.1 glycosyltransferase [Cellulomonas sp. JZ18]
MTDTLSPVDVPTTAAVPVTTPVTAVVVTHGRTGYLRTTLRALAAQTRRPFRVLVVDVAEHADGDGPALGALLEDAFATTPAPVPRLSTVAAPRARSFGEAVSAGLATLADALDERPTPWLWLLHDDSAPAPAALAQLVKTVGHAPSVAVAGCKQRTWTEPERLLEVGLRTTRSGRRVTDVEQNELDQGQHDGRTDVLGVGLAGALVRRDVWDALGGTDPALGPFGDGLDLSRRARLAGHRVVVVPTAVVRHAQAAYHGLRPVRGSGPGDGAAAPGGDAREVDLDGDGEPDGADPNRSFAARRRALLHSRLVGCPLPLLPLVVLMALAAGALRALGQLAVKQPGLAVAEVRVALAAVLRPAAVVRARRRARASRVLPRRTLRPLQATWRDVWRQARDRRLARREARRVVRAPSELELRELAALASRRRVTLAVVTGALLLVTAVALGGLVGPVLSGAQLVGPALARATTGVADAWWAATSGWVAGGLGAPGPADPLLLALLPLAAVLDGDLGAAVAVVVLGGVLLSGLGAWAAAGAATRSTGVRAWAAVTWAAAPALLLAVGDGRVGAVLAHAALPWVALGLARAVGVQRVDQVLSGLATVRRDLDEPEVRDVEDGPAAQPPVTGPPAAVPVTPEPVLADESDVVTPVRGVPALPQPRSAPSGAVPAVAAGGAPRLTAPVSAAEVAPADAPAAAPAAASTATESSDGTDRPGVLVGAPDPTGSVTAAAGAALALALVVAGAPVLLVPALLVLVLVAVVVPRRRGRVLLVAVPGLVLLAPLLVEAVRRGPAGVRLLLAEPGPAVAVAPGDAVARLLGLPADATALVPAALPDALVPFWPFLGGAVLVALALLALWRGRPVARGVRTCWAVAACGLGTATAVAALPASVGPEAVAPAWTGPAVSLAALGLLGAAVLGADRLPERLARHAFGWRQPVVGLLTAVAVVAALAAPVSWAWAARTQDAVALRASAAPVVPVVGQQGATSPAASRVLALSLLPGDAAAGTVAWSLLRADGEQLVDVAAAVATRRAEGGLVHPAAAATDAAAEEVAAVAARLAGGTADDVAPALAALGVADVLVPAPLGDDPRERAARARLVGALDATAGLERVTHDGTGTLWRVRPASGDVVAAWARLVPAGADVSAPGTSASAVAARGRTVATVVPPGDEDRVLVLAERADPGWQAWLDGRPLDRADAGWRQAFRVGADGGRLEVRYVAPARGAWLAALGATTLVTVLLALPLRRRRGVRT